MQRFMTSYHLKYYWKIRNQYTLPREKNAFILHQVSPQVQPLLAVSSVQDEAVAGCS